jgi:hypothetical protein
MQHTFCGQQQQKWCKRSEGSQSSTSGTGKASLQATILQTCSATGICFGGRPGPWHWGTPVQQPIQ